MTLCRVHRQNTRYAADRCLAYRRFQRGSFVCLPVGTSPFHISWPMRMCKPWQVLFCNDQEMTQPCAAGCGVTGLCPFGDWDGNKRGKVCSVDQEGQKNTQNKKYKEEILPRERCFERSPEVYLRGAVLASWNRCLVIMMVTRTHGATSPQILPRIVQWTWSVHGYGTRDWRRFTASPLVCSAWKGSLVQEHHIDGDWAYLQFWLDPASFLLGLVVHVSNMVPCCYPPPPPFSQPTSDRFLFPLATIAPRSLSMDRSTNEQKMDPVSFLPVLRFRCALDQWGTRSKSQSTTLVAVEKEFM